MHPNFDTINVSTQTFTVHTNIINIDLAKTFNIFDLTSEIIQIKLDLLSYSTENKSESSQMIKGIIPKKKKKPKNKPKNFLNCVTLIIHFDKNINTKIFRNGVFQLTGCKNISHVKSCVNLILTQFKIKPQCYNLPSNVTEFEVYIKSAMRNIDFDINYKINRLAIASYLDENTDYKVMPPAARNVGVKIKIPINDMGILPILHINYRWEAETISNTLQRENAILLTNKVNGDQGIQCRNSLERHPTSINTTPQCSDSVTNQTQSLPKAQIQTRSSNIQQPTNKSKTQVKCNVSTQQVDTDHTNPTTSTISTTPVQYIEIEDIVANTSINGKLIFTEQIMKFNECFSIIEPDERKLRLKLIDKYVSISIFQNGKILMSGPDALFQQPIYNWLTDLFTKIKPEIVKYDPPKTSFRY